MTELTAFVDAYGLAAAAALLLIKSAGAPLPVPSDALMIVIAARVADGAYALWSAFLVLLLALVAGGIAQFLLARGPARGGLYRWGRYLGLPPARLDAATARVAGAGSASIGLGVLLPGVRSVTVAACGLASVPIGRFLVGLAAGSGVFLALHFAMGYGGWVLLGPLVRAALAIGWPLAGAAAVVGLLGWLVVRLSQRRGAPTGEVAAEAVEAFGEATCPICLALGAIGPIFAVAREGEGAAEAA